MLCAMRVLVPLLLLTVLPSCRENKPTPVVSDPATTTSKPAPSSSTLPKLTTAVTLGPSTTDGAVAFDVVGGSVAALAFAVDCPKAPTGCALRPDSRASRTTSPR